MSYLQQWEHLVIKDVQNQIYLTNPLNGSHPGFNSECSLSRGLIESVIPSQHGKSTPDCQSVTHNPNTDPGNFRCKHFGPGSASELGVITCPEGSHIDFSTRPWACERD